ncbi:hypothetical protein [Tardiphaga sp.]|jgi:hypothetical protein|uniref:hypothetical protein n=1 Tax=Tardiphaga sp. TaxID=1926292 RepID=UPI0037D9F193
MRSSMQRLVSAAVLVTLASVLTGCGGASSWDPSDLLDFMDTKKKLPGDRRPVFPEGVPGLEQGVPRDLYKESQQRQQAEQAAAAAAAAPPPQPAPGAPSGRKASKSKSRGDVEVGTVRQDGSPAAAEEGSAAGVAQPPAGRKITRRRTTAPPPEEPAAAPAAPAQQSQPSGGFPAPMPSGSFSR